MGKKDVVSDDDAGAASGDGQSESSGSGGSATGDGGPGNNLSGGAHTWPFPFERFSEGDPIDEVDGVLEHEHTKFNERLAHAREHYPEWDGSELSEVELGDLETVVEDAIVDPDGGGNRATDAAGAEATDAVGAGATDAAGAGDSVLQPDEVLSPDNDYELHENVAVDLVRYVRSNTVRNEEQFLLLALSYVSGFSEDPDDFISSVTIGTSSGGKTHLKDRVDRLFVNCDVMDASSGSDKVLVYSDDWDEADIISMGELQQPSEEMREFMKRAHGGDSEVVIRSTRGNPHDGFHEEVIRKDAKSYHFTYAQMDADFEFWNRLLKIPVHESESKNRAVGRMAFGHEDIGLGGDVEYGFGFDAGTERLQAHMLDVKRNAPGHVLFPEQVDGAGWDAWSVVKPIFRHARSESNRIYKMVRNLIKASARLNYQHRETSRFERAETGDEGGREVQTVRATVAEAQDVANVLRCLNALRATTHEIGPRKRAVVEAIKARSDGDGVVDGLEPIVEFMEDSDASQVTRSQLDAILDDLEENYLIGRDGDAIRARNWDQLGEPNVDGFADHFSDSTDPMTGDPFVPSWQDYRAEMMTTGAELLDTPEVDSESADLDTVGAADLARELQEMLELADWEATVAGLVADTLDGQRVDGMGDLPVEGFIGVTDPTDPDVSGVETDGTLLDPEHDNWQRPDKPDEWANTPTKVRRLVQDTISTLVQEDALSIDQVHERQRGRPVDVTLTVDIDA